MHSSAGAGQIRRTALPQAHRALHAVPVYPLVLALAFVLNALLDAGIAPQAAARPLLVALGVAVASTALAGLLLGSRHAGALVVGVIETLLLAAPAWLLLVHLADQGRIALAIFIVLGASGAIGFLSLRIRRGPRRPHRTSVTFSLNLVAAALLAVVLIAGAARGTSWPAVAEVLGAGSSVEPGDDDEPGPDVAILLLDGYPRADTLERVFDVDNGAFLEGLAELGFEVADKSRSNYAGTELTLASMLHACHLPVLLADEEHARGFSADLPTLRSLLDDNPVFDRFRAAGYRVEAVAPGVESVTLRGADRLHDGGQLSEFELHLLRSTGLDRAIWAMDPALILGQHRNRVLWNLETTERLASDPAGGRLIFSHVMSPHMPAVFNRDGSLRVTSYNPAIFRARRLATDASIQEWVEPYVDQLAYLNDRVLDVLDEIVTGNPDAFIIVLSDHGSAVNWTDDMSSSDHDERHSNLFAARTPGSDGLYSRDQTTVNVFPPILNALLEEDVPLQPNLTFARGREFVRIPNPDREDSGDLESAPACLG